MDPAYSYSPGLTWVKLCQIPSYHPHSHHHLDVVYRKGKVSFDEERFLTNIILNTEHGTVWSPQHMPGK